MTNFPKPVTHEFGTYYMVPDLNLYYAFVSYFLDNVEKGKHGKLRVDGHVFEIYSSASGFISPE